MQQHGGFVQPGPLEGSKLTLPAQTLAGNDGSYRDQAKGIALGTGLSMSGGVLRAVGSAFDGAVATWADLPVGLEAPVVESVYLVRAGSGVWLLNRKKSGLYQRVAMTGDRAADWSYLGEWLEEFSDANFEVWHDDDTSRGLKFSLADQPTGTTVTVRSNDLETLGTMAAGWSGVSGHLLRTDNPHGVTAAQVGLGSVDNTRDSDKPVSTAQAAAIATRAPLVHGHAAEDISDSTYVGRGLLTAASAAVQRGILGLTGWATNQWTNGTTDDVPEGVQLYFTNARADARADARIAAQKGQAEGLAPLDAGGKVPTANLPDSIAQADDAARLGGQLPSYYAQASHVHTFAGLTSKPTTLAGYGITDAAAASHTHSGYETAIGNPSANGYLLSSTSAGVRSWVAPYSHPATHAQSVIDSSSGWVTTALAGKQAAGSYLTTTGTAADSAKLGGQLPAYYSQAGHVHNYAGSSTPGGAATTALACTGNAATATTAASCTGNSATATTASSCSGNAATATKLATARTLTIGSKANTFDGSADKAWTLAEIGAASTAALTTEATTRAANDNALWAALYAEQTGGTTCEIPLAATGDGSGVLTIRLWSDVANTATLSNGAFYAELAGTTNLGQSVAMAASQLTTFYIKLPSGSTATMSVLYGWALTRWGQDGTECIVEATNAPKLNGLNTKYIPANVTAIRIWTNLNAGVVAGTTYPWTSATYIMFGGDTMTISGATYPWTSATSIYFGGNSMTISGATYPWTSATYIRFIGNTMTISANLSTSFLTTGNLHLYLSGTGIAVTYTTTRIWPTTMRQVYLRPSVGSMPTADTDRLFIDVDATCTTASTEKVLDARGNCGAVTAASSAARASLAAKGFTVSYNS